MNIFLYLIRYIFIKKLSKKDREEIIKSLKLKKDSYKNKRDGL